MNSYSDSLQAASFSSGVGGQHVLMNRCDRTTPSMGQLIQKHTATRLPRQLADAFVLGKLSSLPEKYAGCYNWLLRPRNLHPAGNLIVI